LSSYAGSCDLSGNLVGEPSDPHPHQLSPASKFSAKPNSFLECTFLRERKHGNVNYSTDIKIKNRSRRQLVYANLEMAIDDVHAESNGLAWINPYM
jgi:hypothetical protein